MVHLHWNSRLATASVFLRRSNLATLHVLNAECTTFGSFTHVLLSSPLYRCQVMFFSYASSCRCAALDVTTQQWGHRVGLSTRRRASSLGPLPQRRATSPDALLLLLLGCPEPDETMRYR